MPKTRQKLNEIIMLRLPEDLKEKVQRMAEQKERSSSAQIRIILKDYFERIEI